MYGEHLSVQYPGFGRLVNPCVVFTFLLRTQCSWVWKTCCIICIVKQYNYIKLSRNIYNCLHLIYQQCKHIMWLICNISLFCIINKSFLVITYILCHIMSYYILCPSLMLCSLFMNLMFLLQVHGA